MMPKSGFEFKVPCDEIFMDPTGSETQLEGKNGHITSKMGI